MLQRCFVNFEHIKHFIVPLEHFDCIPPLLLFWQIVDNSLLNVSDCVFHRTWEHMLGHGFCLAGGLDCLFCRFHDSVAFEGRNLNDFAAQLAAKFCRIDFVPGFFYQVHHVEGDNHRDSKLHQLCGKVKVSLKVCGVNDVKDCVRTLANEIVSGDNFFKRIW